MMEYSPVLRIQRFPYQSIFNSSYDHIPSPKKQKPENASGSFSHVKLTGLAVGRGPEMSLSLLDISPKIFQSALGSPARFSSSEMLKSD